MNIDPDKDGIDHINIYSNGKTKLGRMLSNFYRFPIETDDGNFISVEGYWYWLGIKESPETEILRTLYGPVAKKKGQYLMTMKGKRIDKHFESKIMKAIQYKFLRNSNLLIESFDYLPFLHYYNYNGKIVNVTDKYPWMIEGIGKIRDFLINSIDS